MKLIPLTKGLAAMVDDEDFERVCKLKWHAFKSLHTFYATHTSSRLAGPQRKIFLHRFIMDAPKGKVVDHADGNGLNCQKGNLRICTYTENGRNHGAPKNNNSGYKGVHWDEKQQKWRARIKVDNKRICIGSYDSADAAAQAYRNAALKYHGEFAKVA